MCIRLRVSGRAELTGKSEILRPKMNFHFSRLPCAEQMFSTESRESGTVIFP